MGDGRFLNLRARIAIIMAMPRQKSMKTTDQSRALEIAEEYEQRETIRAQREASIIAAMFIIGGFATVMLAGPQYDHSHCLSYLCSNKLGLCAALAVLYGTMALTARLITTIKAPNGRYMKAREMGYLKQTAFLLAFFVLVVLGLVFMIGVGFLSRLIVPLGGDLGFFRDMFIGVVCATAVGPILWLEPVPKTGVFGEEFTMKWYDY